MKYSSESEHISCIRRCVARARPAALRMSQYSQRQRVQSHSNELLQKQQPQRRYQSRDLRSGRIIISDDVRTCSGFWQQQAPSWQLMTGALELCDYSRSLALLLDSYAFWLILDISNTWMLCANTFNKKSPLTLNLCWHRLVLSVAQVKHSTQYSLYCLHSVNGWS